MAPLARIAAGGEMFPDYRHLPEALLANLERFQN